MEELIITKEHYKNWTWTIIMVLVIVGGGVFIVRQSILLIYTEQIIAGPCQLCVKLNPETGSCWDLTNRKKEAEEDYYKKLKINNNNLSDTLKTFNYSNEQVSLLNKQFVLNETLLIR
jgi:hypothetical protein